MNVPSYIPVEYQEFAAQGLADDEIVETITEWAIRAVCAGVDLAQMCAIVVSNGVEVRAVMAPRAHVSPRLLPNFSREALAELEIADPPFSLRCLYWGPETGYVSELLEHPDVTAPGGDA